MGKKISLFILLLLPLTFFSKLEAFFFCDDLGKFNVEAEWIYFRPSVDTAFLVANPFTTSPTSYSIVPPYNSGWRVGVGYFFDECGDSISVRWSQLRSSTDRTFDGAVFGYFTPTGALATSPTAFHRQDFDYYSFEGLFSHRLWADCRFSWDLLIGAQYVWIGTKDDVTFPGVVGTIASYKQVAHFWGVGPELGLDFNFNVWNGFSLAGRWAGALLVSRPKVNVFMIDPIGTSIAEPLWRITPTIDLRVGLRYDLCLACLDFYAEAGYEAVSYFRGLRSMNLAAFAGVSSSAYEYVNTDLHGPYLELGVLF